MFAKSAKWGNLTLEYSGRHNFGFERNLDKISSSSAPLLHDFSGHNIAMMIILIREHTIRHFLIYRQNVIKIWGNLTILQIFAGNLTCQITPHCQNILKL